MLQILVTQGVVENGLPRIPGALGIIHTVLIKVQRIFLGFEENRLLVLLLRLWRGGLLTEFLRVHSIRHVFL